MDLRSIVLYLNKNRWTAQIIHDNLAGTVAKEATAYSAVTKYFHEAQIGPGNAVPFSGTISPHIDY
jgi:hypothetical protein